MTIDTQGNIYTTGFFEGTADFDPGSGSTNYTPAGWRDIFIQKLDSVGNFLWVTVFGGSSFDEGLSIKTDLFNNIYTTGYFGATVDFDPGIGTNNQTATGLYDIYNLKLSQTPTSSNDEISNIIKISAYPNPTTNEVQITFEQTIYNVELVLSDISGAVIFKQTYSQLSSTNIELKGESNLYILTINTSEGRVTKILVKG
ncbi:MAG: T9SS type A sorting domain-containing protein [Bacteroidetes bacterium]|nr:T9SS type A sorting domain-containing protein [Bacteroidota bacterium]